MGGDFGEPTEPDSSNNEPVPESGSSDNEPVPVPDSSGWDEYVDQDG